MPMSREAHERQLARMRAWRERKVAQGLDTHGRPRRRRAPGPRVRQEDCLIERTRELALEAITWMTGKRRHDPAHLLGVHAFAANLPLEWWMHRDQHSIMTIIEAIEREMEKPCRQLT